jgi:hypothetical protein
MFLFKDVSAQEIEAFVQVVGAGRGQEARGQGHLRARSAMHRRELAAARFG